MKCPSCGKVLTFTRPLRPVSDAVSCQYCFAVVGAEKIVWSDGLFHFDVIGDVLTAKIAPKVILNNQKAKVLDLELIHERALDIIKREPNLRALCGEFEITSDRLRIEVKPEPQEENE